MNEQTFVERRRADWQRLTQLCDLADRTPSRLSGPELRELVKLYRHVSTDLSVARTRTTSLPLVEYLNDLSGRAYGTIYRAPRKPLWPTIVSASALAADTVRRCWGFMAVSALIFFGSAVFAFFLMTAVPETRDYFVQPGMEEMFEHWKTTDFEDRTSAENIMYSGFYASNNPKAAIITGAVGAGTFGFFSLVLLFQNGVMLGALAKEMAPVGRLDFLLSSVAPHGVPELSGIVVAGAAGLLFGWALINPGRRTRADALKAVGKDGATLLATSVALMFIAAPFEGFFSFNPAIPGWLKTTVAVIELLGWAAFWMTYGRRSAAEK